MKKGILLVFFSGFLFAWESSAKADKKSVAAELDLNVVRQIVRANIKEVQKCYTDLIIEGMASKGKILATWDIDDKGRVQNLQIAENTSGKQALEGCVSEKVPNWGFPAAAAGTTFPVSYPFEFH